MICRSSGWQMFVVPAVPKQNLIHDKYKQPNLVGRVLRHLVIHPVECGADCPRMVEDDIVPLSLWKNPFRLAGVVWFLVKKQEKG
eukprot:4358469-Amphidinium_carterae.1